MYRQQKGTKPIAEFLDKNTDFNFYLSCWFFRGVTISVLIWAQVWSLSMLFSFAGKYHKANTLIRKLWTRQKTMKNLKKEQHTSFKCTYIHYAPKKCPPKDVNTINKHLISIKLQVFEIIRLTIIEVLAIINWYSKIAVSNIVYLLMSILLNLMSTLMHFSLYQNSMVISSVLECERVNADGGHFEHHL